MFFGRPNPKLAERKTDRTKRDWNEDDFPNGVHRSSRYGQKGCKMQRFHNFPDKRRDGQKNFEGNSRARP